MCFSAGASFGAGVFLSSIGVVALKKTENPSQWAFAGIPLLFGVQQISEGFVWLSLTRPEYAEYGEPAKLFFLLIAQVIWPFWVPFSIGMMDPNEKYKNLRKVFMGMALAVSLYLGYSLWAHPMEARIDGYHIAYERDQPIQFRPFFGVLYVIATLAPPFFTSLKGMRLLGIAISVSFFVTALFYREYIISVWCFFAAILSFIVLYVLSHEEDEEHSHNHHRHAHA